ncbi:MAG TPA: DUF899 family protein [Xanthobacteraceae bacterium]|jgi:predicted dithiol-disulfide oxidoreductase (DUF899 family)
MAKKPRRKPKRTSNGSPRKAFALHDKHFPGESAGYRKARNALLRSEIELRRQIESVAAARRRLPLGGTLPEDYAFEEGAADIADTTTVRRVRLSELFGDKNTLVAYSFMYGPAMAKACPMCTSILDGLDGQYDHIRQRVSFVVIAKSPIERIRDHARERSWSQLRLLSSANNPYNSDYQGERADGSQWPSLNVFVRRNGQTRHFYQTELLLTPAEPGQNNRHVDMIWPLWNMLDYTPEGRGKDWYPKLAY